MIAFHELYKPSNSNGFPFGFKSSESPSPQRSLSLTTNRITDPYLALILAVYSRYFLRSLGTRWKRSIRLVPVVDSLVSFRVHFYPTYILNASHHLRRKKDRFIKTQLIISFTVSQFCLSYTSSGVDKHWIDLGGRSRRKLGHSAGHCERGTLTSQYGIDSEVRPLLLLLGREAPLAFVFESVISLSIAVNVVEGAVEASVE